VGQFQIPLSRLEEKGELMATYEERAEADLKEAFAPNTTLNQAYKLMNRAQVLATLAVAKKQDVANRIMLSGLVNGQKMTETDILAYAENIGLNA
jgi:hypothetical protein